MRAEEVEALGSLEALSVGCVVSSVMLLSWFSHTSACVRFSLLAVQSPAGMLSSPHGANSAVLRCYILHDGHLLSLRIWEQFLQLQGKRKRPAPNRHGSKIKSAASQKNSGVVTAIAAGRAYCNAPPLIPQGQKRKMFLITEIFLKLFFCTEKATRLFRSGGFAFMMSNR